MINETARISVEEINAFLQSGWEGSSGRCIEVGPMHAIASTTISANQIRPGNMISGPTQFGLSDAAMYYAIFGAIGLEPMAVTSELSIRFLRPCIGTELFARCDLISVGRRCIFGEIKVWTTDASKPSAMAQGTYLRP